MPDVAKQNDVVASPIPQPASPVFDFSIGELENALNSFESVINDPQIVTSTSARRTEPGSGLGINTTCPEVFHEPTYSVSQRSFQDSVGADERLRFTRRVYLFPSESAAVDLLDALAGTPVGCDTSLVESFEEIATSVERSEFDGFDAVTVELERIFDGDELYTTKVDRWVRRDNVVIHVQIGEDATNAAPLLRDALATLDSLG